MFDSSFTYLYMYSAIGNKYMHTDTLSGGAANANPIGAPEYIKITSNAVGYKFNLPYYDDSKAVLSEVEFYSGTERVDYQFGTQGCFNFK